MLQLLVLRRPQLDVGSRLPQLWSPRQSALRLADLRQPQTAWWTLPRFSTSQVETALANKVRMQVDLKASACHLVGVVVALNVVADASLGAGCHPDSHLPVFGVQDGDVHQAGAQVQKLQVVADNGGQVLVITAVPIPVPSWWSRSRLRRPLWSAASTPQGPCDTAARSAVLRTQ